MCYTVSNKIAFIHICMYVNFLAVFDTEATAPQVATWNYLYAYFN